MENEVGSKTTIGKAELVDFPDQGLRSVPARIDTGAKTSAIWASKTIIRDKVLRVVLFGEGCEFFTGEEIIFTSFQETVVSTSTGEADKRFKVRLAVRVGGRKVRASFTLADRSTQVYPVLIGRNILSGKFIVDVKQGHTLKREEKLYSEELRSKLDTSE